jgi:hypothetical protein
MKRKITHVSTLLLFIISFIAGQEKLQEQVGVTAVEVPVRVLLKGNTVKDLTREDFELFENGIKMEIQAFEVKSRIMTKPIKVDFEKTTVGENKRVFVLIFNIFDYTIGVGEGIDYFFNNIFRPGDQIIILTENCLLKIDPKKNLSCLISDLKETLKKYKQISSYGTFKSYRDLREEADRLLEAFRRERDWDRATMNFFDNYQRIWKEYKRRMILPDIDLYRSVIRRIRQIEGEKWAICFLQREIFPRLKNQGRLDYEIRRKLDEPPENPVVEVMQRTIATKKAELDRIMDVSSDFPTELIKNLFMEANITFHLILMKSMRDVQSQDFELREVAQDYEDCFKQISRSTGGYMAFSNKAVEILDEASRNEDYYYLLVYYTKQKSLDTEVDINVKVRREGVRVIHLKRLLQTKVPIISIENFSIEKKTLKFSLANFAMMKIHGKEMGIADIKVTVFNDKSEIVFDESKTLDMERSEIKISLSFNWLASGNYFVIIQAIDKITNEQDVFSSPLRI